MITGRSIQKMLLLIISLWYAAGTKAQISGNGHCGSLITAYTNGLSNDSIYYFPQGTMGSLIANPPGGNGPWDFVWQIYNPGLNQWMPMTTQNDVGTSTVTNLATGGYRVVIRDFNNTLVGTYRAWIGWSTPPTIQVSMTADCNDVQLTGQFQPGSVTGYYNPPQESMTINQDTEVQVCFTGSHSWVSDIGFYLVGPPSCGSPVVLLSPNPGAIGQGPVCNSGDNISNLCFSTESTAKLDVCATWTPLTGTYGAYGPGAGTPINWSPIYGCDVTNSGWAVQIYDCIGLDVGYLTDATLTFSGLNGSGSNQTVVYSTPPGFSSYISDNSCTPQTASIFVVPPTPNPPIAISTSYQWNASPQVSIPNPTTSLNVNIPAPSVATVFSLDPIFKSPSGTILNQPNGAGWNCPVNGTSSVNFTPIPPVTPDLSGPSELCIQEPGTFTASVSGGTWSGPNVDPVTGVFAGDEGTYTLTYTMSAECYNPATIQAVVNDYSVVQQQFDIGYVCTNSGPFPIPVELPDITVEGNGVFYQGDEVYFNPSMVNVGSYALTQQGLIGCTTYDYSYLIDVIYPPQLVIDQVPLLCEADGPVTLNSNLDGGTWDGYGITDPVAGIFDPGTVGQGVWIVDYTISGLCPAYGYTQIKVVTFPVVTIFDPGPRCANHQPFTIYGDPVGGIWSGGGANATIPGGTSGIIDPTILGAGPVTLSYTVDNGCVTTENFTFEILAPPQPDLGPDVSFCEGTVYTLDLPGVWDNISWSSGQSTPSINLSKGGVFGVTAYEGICYGYDEVKVSLLPSPKADLGPDLLVCLGDSAALSVADPDNDTYLWSNGSDAPVIWVHQAEDWRIPVEVSVAATNECGTTTDEIRIDFEDCNPYIYIPNAFTPDGDGINDAWRPETENLVSYELVVIDRWGIQVFSSTDPDEYWMGENDGGLYFVESGVYSYRLRYTTKEFDARYLNGHVVVIR